jgi:hypothetical protein
MDKGARGKQLVAGTAATKAANDRRERSKMRTRRLSLGALLLAAAVSLPLITAGCGEHHYYRAYDPYDQQYHRWDNRENVYYQQWVVETHRSPRREFRALDQQDQREYWKWRQNHHEHDHDRNQDLDRDHGHHG